MYTIKNRGSIEANEANDMTIIAEDQVWEKKDYERLAKEENVFYRGGVFAIQKIKRMNSSPLLRLAIEDDGFITFNDKNCLSFDTYWLNDLHQILEMAIKENGKEN